VRLAAKILVFALAAVGAFYLAVLSFAFFQSHCTRWPIGTADSPDGKWKAEIMRTECSDKPAKVEAILLNNSSRTESTILTAPPTTTDIRLNWTRQGKLRVSFPENLAVVEGASRVGGVEVVLDRQAEREY